MSQSNGLIGWYKFDDGSGSTATDSCGVFGSTAHNGTLVNSPTWSTGKNGGALTFASASSQYVQMGGIFDFTSQPFTICYWVYLTTYSTSLVGQGPPIIFKGPYPTDGYYDQIASTGEINFISNHTGLADVTTSAVGSVPLNAWTHVCHVRNGTSVRIYINGVDATATAGSHANFTSSSRNFQVCFYFVTGFSLYSNATVDDLRIYNRNLSAAEVWEIFQNG